jgi:hypothetical protein
VAGELQQPANPKKLEVAVEVEVAVVAVVVAVEVGGSICFFFLAHRALAKRSTVHDESGPILFTKTSLSSTAYPSSSSNGLSNTDAIAGPLLFRHNS